MPGAGRRSGDGSEKGEQKSGNKKRASNRDDLRQSDDSAPQQVNNLLAPQAETASREISATTGSILYSPARVQVHVPIQGRSMARRKMGSSNNEHSKAALNDVSRDNDSNVSSEKPKTRRQRGPKRKEADQQEETIDSLGSKLESMKQLSDKQSAQVKLLKSKKAEAIKENRTRSRAQTNLKLEVKQWRERAESERRVSTDLQKRLVEKETYIAQSQEAIFSRVGKGAGDALDDTYLTDKLKGVRMLCEDLIAENAVSSLDGIPDEYMEKWLERAMPSPLPLTERKTLYQLFRKEEGAPRMLLSILLSYSLCDTLFQHPFAFLEATSNGEKEGLQRILDHGMLSK
jgi:hypothetical protein